MKRKSKSEIIDPGMGEVLRILQESGRLGDLIAVEILKGSNEKALDILRVCGCRAIVPGTNYAPINDMAQFYNCNPRYCLSLLNRFGLTPAKTPVDVMKCGFPLFMWQYQLEEKFAVSRRYSTFTMIDRENGEHYEFNHGDKAGNFYSARVVLALSMLMYFGRTINPEAKGNEMYKRLLSSTYADAARDVLARRKEERTQAEQSPEPVKAEAVAPEVSDNAAVMNDGKVVMTADFLAGLIKTAVHEAVAEVVKTTIPVVPPAVAAPPSTPASVNKRYAPGTIFNAAGNPCRLAKPANWDEVLLQYQAGAITQAAAAKMTGMSVTTFSKYSKGLSQFYLS